MKRTKEQLTAVEAYWIQAQDFVRLSGDWVVLTREMPEQLESWKQYFRDRLGFLPRGIEMLEEMKIETFLVPTERPEWFSHA